MKNFTLLLSALMLMGATASAAGLSQKTVKVQNPGTFVKVENTQKSHDFNILNSPREFDFSKATTQRPAFSRAAEDIIVDPEGTTKKYMATTYMWEYFMGLYFYENTSMAKVVWGDNDEVYLKNILNIGLEHYVKGTYADGKIRIDLPQTIYYEEEEGLVYEYQYNICDLEIISYIPDGEEEPVEALDYVVVDQQENYAIYNVDEDGNITLELSDWEASEEMYEDYSLLPQKIIALTAKISFGEESEEGWAGYGIATQSLVPFDMEETLLPEGVEAQKWAMSYTNISGEPENMFVKVAIDDEHIYLGGFDEDIEGWAVGTIDGDRVTFASEQYLGYMMWYETSIFFMTANMSEEEYEEDGEIYLNPVAEWTDGITFKYDAEAQRLEALDNVTIVLNANTSDLDFLDLFTAPTIYVQDPALLNAAPQTPEIYLFIPWSIDFYGGQGLMVWDIPAINVNGELLDTEKMYYHILFDGEVEPLDPDVYPFVEEEIWDIPYDYTDGSDIYPMGSLHDVYFYTDGVTTFGCQSFYVGSDGVTYASEIGIYVDSESGIEGVKEFSKVVSTTYFDLSGREVANPQAGLYIKSMKLENGKIRNIKVSVK